MTYSSSDAIKGITIGSKTVDLAGYVLKIFPLGNYSAGSMLKFLLSNGSGDKIQIVAWKETADAIEKLGLQVYSGIYLENSEAKGFSQKSFKQGTVDFEVHLNKGAIFERIADYEPIKEVKSVSSTKLLEELDHSDHNVYLELSNVYIKTMPIKVNSVLYDTVALFKGTDKTNVIECKMLGFELFSDGISRGTPIKLRGTFISNDPPVVHVDSSTDIEKRDGTKLDLSILISASTPMTRKYILPKGDDE